MSYCRLSDDDCDIYAYEGRNGFMIFVARRRVRGDMPRWPDPTRADADEWRAAIARRESHIERNGYEEIDLPYAGEDFCERDLESFYDRLLELKNIGYRLPDWVLPTVLAEMEDGFE